MGRTPFRKRDGWIVVRPLDLSAARILLCQPPTERVIGERQSLVLRIRLAQHQATDVVGIRPQPHIRVLHGGLATQQVVRARRDMAEMVSDLR